MDLANCSTKFAYRFFEYGNYFLVQRVLGIINDLGEDSIKSVMLSIFKIRFHLQNQYYSACLGIICRALPFEEYLFFR
jgi:hypothetical protein